METKEKTARLYRMVMPDHLCPYGLKAKDLLEREGYEVEDHHLTSKEETEAFKGEHEVETTPQAWIAGERVGGYDDLLVFFDRRSEDEDDTSYQPIVALFSVAMLLTLAFHWASTRSWDPELLPDFVATSMALLALQKLGDVEAFSTSFLNYDLLARRWVRYAKLYPFGELLAGVLMLANTLPFLSAPIALFIGTVGATSVVKAVYIDRRELKCACVGGNSNVPLGFVSLTENLMMITMGLWTLV